MALPATAPSWYAIVTTSARNNLFYGDDLGGSSGGGGDDGGGGGGGGGGGTPDVPVQRYPSLFVDKGYNRRPRRDLYYPRRDR